MSVHNLIQPSSSWYGYDKKCMDILLSKCLRIIRILNMCIYSYMAPFENYEEIMVIMITYMNIEEFGLKIHYLQFMFCILNIRK